MNNMETESPKIDLRKQPTVECEKCNCTLFKEVVLIKRVPAELTGTRQDNVVPFPTYRCDDCGHVNKEFDLFNNNDHEL